ncbi:hypothetical protein NFHSH190041_15190 [Shewanella sp. NFH-SH190041]|uniref:BsuPI-related putative proteinase inhibitor n=1 Tax=Shewanella sp. NFH-SH190041 TaxID=2950245 RepID=UPI0021C4AC6E|nr:BsuPI-related putative proteinase inhibitor [Shewanella sp. NFH-SH190041]BDM64067.1 hypothetical protein NFHSH190041_15190 [Shewanella sp. NFH-SH190041]
MKKVTVALLSGTCFMMLATGCQSSVAEQTKIDAPKQTLAVTSSLMPDTVITNLRDKRKPMGHVVLSGTLSQETVAGQAAKLTLTVTNPTSKRIALEFHSGMVADIWLLDPNGHRIWAWSEGMMFTQAVMQQVWQPGQTMTDHFQVPAKVMAEVNAPGFKWEARFMGRVLQGNEPAMTPISLDVVRP